MEVLKNKTVQKQLSILGLTEYEIRVYNELIKLNKIGATNLARISKVSRGRIYDVLENLIRKGFCKVLPGARKNYKAVAPEIAIGNHLTEIQTEMQQKEKIIEETSISLQKIFDAVNKDDSPDDHVQILTSQSAINERVRQLEYECKNVLRVFVKAPIIMDNSKKDSNDRMKNQKKKNLKIKQIYEYKENGYKAFANSVIKAREKGADFDVRVAMKLPLKLVIFDDNHALFTLNKENNSIKNYSMMSVSNTYLTKAMAELFEFYWEVAIPLEEFMKEYPIKNIEN